MKKVLVGCTVADVKEYCLDKYAEGLKRLTYKNFDILLADNSKDEKYATLIQEKYKLPVIRTGHFDNVAESVIHGLNVLRQKALDKGYDYFLCLEQDVVPPPNIIELLLSAEKDLVTGIAPHLLVREHKTQEIALLAFHDKNNPGKYVYIDWNSAQQYNEGLLEVDYCAMTCFLFSKNILKKIPFRYELTEATKTNPRNLLWHDFTYCIDAQKLGFKIYAHLGAKCEHYFYGGFSLTLGDTTDIHLKKN
ncbi:glycosyltransferase family 2 protein [Candidatus Woesearchaeota archaeon]|nr:glycosyltransferase family 2 protein [Candidatus Woesearchaeota archaeon]